MSDALFLKRLQTFDAQVLATLTRPNDTTAYAAGDAVMNSTSSPSMITLANMAKRNGGSGRIRSAIMYQSVAPNPKVDFLFHIYESIPSGMPNDNAAPNLADAEARKWIGSIYFPFTSYAITTGPNLACASGPIDLDFVCPSDSANLYALVTIASAAGYTPTALEQFDFRLFVEQRP